MQTAEGVHAGFDEAALQRRIDSFDWASIRRDLDARGCALTPPLLDAAQCAWLIALYDEARAFRSRVVMQHYAFGAGEYRYLDYPLPPLVAAVRRAAYARLATVANDWMATLREARRFPPDHAAFLDDCRANGQARATPLILKYEAGDYNRLHQDRYGAVTFPLQLVVALSQPDEDFGGGEFVLVEQQPRRQSVAEAVRLARGQALVFAGLHRPVSGSRGHFRATVRHGLSRVRWGRRYALGVIFHDAP